MEGTNPNLRVFVRGGGSKTFGIGERKEDLYSHFFEEENWLDYLLGEGLYTHSKPTQEELEYISQVLCKDGVSLYKKDGNLYIETSHGHRLLYEEEWKKLYQYVLENNGEVEYNLPLNAIFGIEKVVDPLQKKIKSLENQLRIQIFREVTMDCKVGYHLIPQEIFVKILDIMNES